MRLDSNNVHWCTTLKKIIYIYIYIYIHIYIPICEITVQQEYYALNEHSNKMRGVAAVTMADPQRHLTASHMCQQKEHVLVHTCQTWAVCHAPGLVDVLQNDGLTGRRGAGPDWVIKVIVCHHLKLEGNKKRKRNITTI